MDHESWSEQPDGKADPNLCKDCGTIHGWGNRGVCVEALKIKLTEVEWQRDEAVELLSYLIQQIPGTGDCRAAARFVAEHGKKEA